MATAAPTDFLLAPGLHELGRRVLGKAFRVEPSIDAYKGAPAAAVSLDSDRWSAARHLPGRLTHACVSNLGGESRSVRSTPVPASRVGGSPSSGRDSPPESGIHGRP